MITFPELGAWGRLGNQLFEMAATIGCALEHREPYGFPRWAYEDQFGIRGCFYNTLPEGPAYREAHFYYTPIPHREGLRLYGFFQTERYFGKFAPRIRQLLTPRFTISRSTYLGVASIHVRRGDYLTKPDFHRVLPVEYYDRAAQALRPYGVGEFLVFSDDPGWCEEHLVRGRRGWRLAPQTNEVQHLAEMSACQFHIIANSAFSWWAAWLDPRTTKVVIAPTPWFGPAAPHNTRDLVPAAWRQVS